MSSSWKLFWNCEVCDWFVPLVMGGGPVTVCIMRLRAWAAAISSCSQSLGRGWAAAVIGWMKTQCTSFPFSLERCVSGQKVALTLWSKRCRFQQPFFVAHRLPWERVSLTKLQPIQSPWLAFLQTRLWPQVCWLEERAVGFRLSLATPLHHSSNLHCLVNISKHLKTFWNGRKIFEPTNYNTNHVPTVDLPAAWHPFHSAIVCAQCAC